MKLLDDFDKLSDLVLSIGTHSKERPLEPIEISKMIKQLTDELPSESLKQISKRLNLKGTDDTQVRNFLTLLNLPESVHYALGYKVIDEVQATVPFTLGVEFSKLDNHDDMDYLVKSALEHKFKKEDAIRVVQLKKKHPEKLIEECVDDVLKVRPVRISGYILVNTLKEDTLTKLNSLSNSKGVVLESLVIELLKESLKDGNIMATKIKGKHIFLTVDKILYNSILQIQTSNNIRFRDLIDFLINKVLIHD